MIGAVSGSPWVTGRKSGNAGRLARWGTAAARAHAGVCQGVCQSDRPQALHSSGSPPSASRIGFSKSLPLPDRRSIPFGRSQSLSPLQEVVLVSEPARGCATPEASGTRAPSWLFEPRTQGREDAREPQFRGLCGRRRNRISRREPLPIKSNGRSTHGKALSQPRQGHLLAGYGHIRHDLHFLSRDREVEGGCVYRAGRAGHENPALLFARADLESDPIRAGQGPRGLQYLTET